MYLDEAEEKMLAGKEGKGAQKAMEILKAKGEAEDAKRMVKIVYAHLMPPDTMFFPYGRQGRWARELTGELTEGVTRLKVPATMEPKFVDLAIAKDIEYTDELIKEMRSIMLPAASPSTVGSFLMLRPLILSTLICLSPSLPFAGNGCLDAVLDGAEPNPPGSF